MSTVRDMLVSKQPDVWSVKPTDSVYHAIEIMAKKEVGALPVLNADGGLVGIISERDYARKVILKNKSSKDTRVAEIMTRDVVFVSEATTVDRCMSLMSQKKIRHLPVMAGETLLAIITIADVLKFNITEQLLTIEELESYIKGETGGSG